MNFDINKLRQLVKNGEYLEENFNDVQVRNQWLYNVDNFVNGSDNQCEVTQLTKKVRTFTNRRFGIDSFNAIMGFLRNSYNSYKPENGQNLSDFHISSGLQNVFIVHGHDNDLIEEVKECVLELELNPIVLHEQINQGRTIIEKLEHYLGNCKCAVILYTPCDMGKSAKEKNFSPRARQNVVYEHGLFQGALSRKRVILLKKGNTIIPADNDGVVYISVELEDWKDRLKKEIQAIDEPNIMNNKIDDIPNQSAKEFDEKNTHLQDDVINKEDLTHSEKQFLTVMLNIQDNPGESCYSGKLKQEMLDTGVSGVAYNLATKKLLARNFIISEIEHDINGNPYTVYSITETGDKWIELHSDEILNFGASMNSIF